MSLQAKSAGAWVAGGAQVKQASAWAPADSIWVKEGGVWVKEWSNALKPGDAYGGGFYVGTMAYDGHTYALVVADKSAESVSVWSSVSGGFAAAPAVDGKTITDYLVSTAGALEAARLCRAYTGGGFDDWFLPCEWELELLYRNLKPDATANNTSWGANAYSVPAGSNYVAGNPAQTTVAAFQAGGAQALANTGTARTYWSSTYDSSIGITNTRRMDTGVGGSQSFSANTPSVRPMRRVQLT